VVEEKTDSLECALCIVQTLGMSDKLNYLKAMVDKDIRIQRLNIAGDIETTEIDLKKLESACNIKFKKPWKHIERAKEVKDTTPELSYVRLGKIRSEIIDEALEEAVKEKE